MYDDADHEDERVLYDATEETDTRPFYWSQSLQQGFREELEKCANIFRGMMHFTYSNMFLQTRYTRYVLSRL
jgi:hypothetical protein